LATRKSRPIYRSKQWKLTRLSALEAAKWRCQECGRAGVLEVHHVKPLADGGAGRGAVQHPVRQRLQEFLT